MWIIYINDINISEEMEEVKIILKILHHVEINQSEDCNQEIRSRLRLGRAAMKELEKICCWRQDCSNYDNNWTQKTDKKIANKKNLYTF